MLKINNILFIFICLAPFHVFSAISLVEWRSEWAYFKGRTEPSQPVSAWYGAGFNDSEWLTGYAPFRYGDGTGGTLLSDMQGNYISLYLRKSFVVEELDKVDELRVFVDYDDGFVMWVNGELVMQQNAPQNLSYNQPATANHESGNYEVYTFKRDEFKLVNGTNIIAIQGLNVSYTSSDFYFDMKLEGITRLPETGGVQIHTGSGFFTEPFTIVLSSSAVGDDLKYTLDGSDPRYSENAISATSPVSVLIDPESTAGGRGKTGGVVVRASKFETGFEPGKPESRTYIFLKQVIAQRHPGGSWPINNINGQWIDLPMDSRITTHFNYRDLMEDAMTDIPTISMTTDPDHLFDPGRGIYVNARYRGRLWERPGNIELINPDGSRGFNINAGIRIRGGWSRHPEFPKHAFRVFFRSEYGEGRLRYPLFGDEGVSNFDKIDFRTSQNYSWSKGGSEGKHNTMNRDVFSRDTQGAMGQPYTRSRYYHLYINGLYWGIFQTQERAEAAFAETYFGGALQDYDVVKVDVGDDWNIYDIEATDGNTDAWQVIWNICQQGFASNENYFRLIGYNAQGERDTSMNVLVDIDNLIDYMLIIFYGGNFDAPVSKFRGNRDPNNFFAIYDRGNPNEGFKFLIHDAEHSLLTDAVGPGVGLHENRVNIGNPGSGGMNVTRFEKFHPQWLHHRLTENAEYRMRFADRVYRHFFNEGIFLPDSCIARFKKTSDQLNMAIIAESARWGDVGMSSPRTKNTDWLPAVNRVVNDYMPYRSDIVLNQLRAENLYGTVQPPVLKHDDVVISSHSMRIMEAMHVMMENPNLGGTIYYTLNGTDPRAVGGAPSAQALATTQNTTIVAPPGGSIKARVWSGSSWSALREIGFQDAALFEYLKITELHYHPPDQGEVLGTELEFLELKNTGSTILNLSGLSFTTGISFTFPEGAVINPGAFVVLASNGEAFADFYGIPSSFVYDGQLSNSGEKIVLETAEQDVVISFTYADTAPWPVEADGEGPSLVSVEKNPTGDPNSYSYWTISASDHGSPFADDPASGFMIGWQQLIEQQETKYLNLDQVYTDHAAGSLTYSITNNRPAHVHATINGHMLALAPLKRGDAQIQITVSDGVDTLYKTDFRVLVHPLGHSGIAQDFTFNYWASSEPDFSYPEHMLFLQSETNDPGLDDPLQFPYFIAHNDYHANDQGKIGSPYSLTGRTRLNGLGDDGISFINTGRGRDLGGALVALDTRGVSNLSLSWTAGTILKNDRVYAIRLQYRTNIHEDFKDLMAGGRIQEYVANVNNHSHVFDAISLPRDLLNRDYVQLLWRYYHVSGTSGPRAMLRLDDIHIGTFVGVAAPEMNDVQVYARGKEIFVDIQGHTGGVMKVFNLTGQELMAYEFGSGGQHAVSTQLPAGLYIVRVEGLFGGVGKKVLITD